MPKNSDLSLKTYNGGISVADVKEQINFNARNGGVALSILAGDIRAEKFRLIAQDIQRRHLGGGR